MLCKKCNKRMAVVFLSKMEKGEQVTEGYCFRCAKELNIPQVDEMTKNMGISDDDLTQMEEISDQLMESMEGSGDGDFEFGGAETIFPFLNNTLKRQEPKNVSTPEDSQSSKEADTKNRSQQQKAKKKEKFKFLNNYCTNLTERAREGKMDVIIGRDKEIYRVVQILSRRTKNNPCLIGEPGVGKTAIAEGIAQKIINEDVPFRLSDKEVYLMDLTSLVAGTQFRGQFESRVKGLINEVKTAGNIILFIDEVHTLVGTGDSEGSMSAANILKPALSRGEIQVIGATTFNEYRKYIENDSALERRFQPVTVNEPTIDETVDILKGIKSYYENHHRVKVSDGIIQAAAVLSERYITDRYLPDKAIDLLDEACSYCSIQNKDITRYDQLNKTLKVLYDEQEELASNTKDPDYERIAIVKTDIMRVKEDLKEIEPKVAQVKVTMDGLAKVIELWTGIPASKIQQNDLRKLSGLRDSLKSKIIGQDEAVDLVAAAIKRSRVQISKRRRPASFIFVGPTGVGKTELVKVLAEELFDSVDPLIRLDMSEFMEKHAVSRLIGSPPGYVGYDEAGQLTEKVRRKPYSVILFDEIEKAHPDVMNILLQILDEGKVTDAHGRVVNFENTVLAMTSNAGSRDKVGVAGFNREEGEVVKTKAMKALSDFLRPEFLSRVDEIVVFNRLKEEDLRKIAGLMLDELKEPLREQNIELSYDDKATAYLTKQAQGGKFGARDLRKTIRKDVEDRIANILVDNFDNDIRGIAITAENNAIKVEYL